MNKILITGGTGFVGQALGKALSQRSRYVRATVRDKSSPGLAWASETIETGPLENFNGWDDALKGIELVIHCAARAHRASEKTAQLYELYNKTNSEVTGTLAECSVKQGVRQMIFISSAHVFGTESNGGVFSETSIPSPQGPYAQSKYNAEISLKRVAEKSALKYSIIRPPLVYGPGVKANFLKLIRLVDLGLPLPFSSVRNEKSFIYIENLVDFICSCVANPAAENNVWLPSDGQNISTPDLVRLLASGLQKSPRLFSFPLSILKVLMQSVRQENAYNALCGSLALDTSKTQSALDWQPPYSLEQGIKKTLEWYKPNAK